MNETTTPQKTQVVGSLYFIMNLKLGQVGKRRDRSADHNGSQRFLNLLR